MNPLRVLGDWLAGPPPLKGMVRGRGEAPTTPPPVPLTDHERWMRHTGRPECPIPDHADALRLLGRMTIERDAWRQRAELAEEKLRHPSSGQAA